MFQTKELVVAKLFAKHIKLKDAIEYVRKTWYVRKLFIPANLQPCNTNWTSICIGVGTPSRIIDLLDAGVYLARLLSLC